MRLPLRRSWTTLVCSYATSRNAPVRRVLSVRDAAWDPSPFAESPHRSGDAGSKPTRLGTNAATSRSLGGTAEK